MKLVSVQSRGNRILKIYQKLPSFFVHGFIISNPFNDNAGWISRVFWHAFDNGESALKAAAEWLEEAKE